MPEGFLKIAALAMLAALATGFAGWAAIRTPPTAALHLSGDGAAAVLALLPGVAVAPNPGSARLEVVLLRRRDNMRHVEGLDALCRGRCDGQAVTALVRLVPGRARKTVVIDIGRFGAGGSLDAGRPLAAAVASCAARVVRAELARLDADPQPCAGGRRRILALPWGL